MFDERISIVSPAGIAVYPHLHAPDHRFRSDGEYKAAIRIAPGDEADKLEARLTKYADGALPHARSKNWDKAVEIKESPWRPFEREEDGSLLIKTKARATGKNRYTDKQWSFRPNIVDGQNKPIPVDTQIGSGSILKLLFEVAPYNMPEVGAGITLRLDGVQVLKLQLFGPNTKHSGFDTTPTPFDHSKADFAIHQQVLDEFEEYFHSFRKED